MKIFFLISGLYVNIKIFKVEYDLLYEMIGGGEI